MPKASQPSFQTRKGRQWTLTLSTKENWQYLVSETTNSRQNTFDFRQKLLSRLWHNCYIQTKFISYGQLGILQKKHWFQDAIIAKSNQIFSKKAQPLRSNMKKQDLFQIYEKSYFHEIDMREKLSSRMQIPLAIIVAEISLLGYVLQKLNNIQSGLYGLLFIICYILSTILVLLSIYFFIRSWYNFEYAFLPTADETENYQKELNSFYEEYAERETLTQNAMFDYVYDYYKKCSTKNTLNNDKRSIYIHKTSSFLILAFVGIFVTLLFVTLSDPSISKAYARIQSSCFPTGETIINKAKLKSTPDGLIKTSNQK